MAPGEFLRAAARLADAVAEYHATHALHGAITPDAFVHTSHGVTLRDPVADDAQARWPYLAPEQTGRLLRPVDARSDLYALGVVLYELLVGTRPLQARDPLEWAHAHVAQSPRHPAAVVTDTPPGVAEVVLRLLAKDPDERYQTAHGLRWDVGRCLTQWEAVGAVATFPLGERDHPGRVVVPQRVYGRDAERARLLDAFAAVANASDDARPRLTLVAGGPGVGKSALVRELARPVADAHGLFASGKFEQYRGDVPYAPLVQAFRGLAQLIVALPEPRAMAWRLRLRETLGANAAVVTDLLPEVALVIGPQPPAPPLSPAESHHRFAHVFRRFVGAFATRAQPLVLFIDDLQWGDASSLRLLGDVLAAPELRHLHVVSAYRDAEAPADHPVHAFIAGARDSGAVVDDIALGALTPSATRHLVADALRTSADRAGLLARTLHDKARGNPLFLTQLLTALHRGGLLRFEASTLEWRWDAAAIAGLAVSDDVVTLLADQLATCAPALRELLGVAACIGSQFDAGTLGTATGLDATTVATLLGTATHEGFTQREGTAWRFVHDRIQQAAHGVISADRRPALHRRIGLALLDHPDALFDAVSQLNLGLPATAATDRLAIAELNRRVALAARATGAFRAASDYARTALDVLGADGWATRRAVAFELAVTRAECELAAGRIDAAEEALAPAAAHAETRDEQATCHRVRIALCTARAQLGEAYAEATACLQLFDIALTLHPSEDDVAALDAELRATIGDRSIESLADTPRGPVVDAALEVLAVLLPTAYFVDARLHRLVAIHMVLRTLREGASDQSPMAFAAYGFELAIAHHFAEAERFGELAQVVMERHGFVRARAKVYNVIGDVVAPWRGPLQVASEIVRRSVTAGDENGDLVFACLSEMNSIVLRLAEQESLELVHAEAERVIARLRRDGHAPLADSVVVLRQLMRSLLGRTDGANMSDDEFDEDAFVAALPSHPFPFTATVYHGAKLQLQVIWGDPDAWRTARTLRPLVDFLRGQYVVVDAALYGTLAGGPPDEMAADVALLATFAESYPPSFAHRHRLAAAELMRTSSRALEALGGYDAAIAGARANGFPRDAAIAAERAAALAESLGLTTAAAGYRRDAYASYQALGATGKVARIASLHPELASASPNDVRPSSPPGVGERLDTLAVVRATQAISGEIVLERLFERLLHLVMAQAGAERAMLLLANDERLEIAASAAARDGVVSTRVYEPPAHIETGGVPLNVVTYVQRTGEPLSLDDALAHPTFGRDDVIATAHTRSILCLPIRREGLDGVLYLENNLVAGAFGDRVTMTTALAAQAAISLQNAMLVRDLERESAGRARSEDRLRQAQKMEAIGQLAGGIAHDFNNLLTVIGSYSTFALESLAPDDPVRDDIAEIQRAGERAAALTRQLLAFGRRQMLAPRPIDLNDVVQGLLAMLRRLIGEDVELDTRLARGAAVVRADPGQVEQIVVNLVVNARDAMPLGGRVTMATEHTADGRWIALDVTDTGVGMDEDTRSRVFEPFFTTKALGRGTGLGLSTVYGIVRQSDGQITVTSAPGAGTTFRVLLPRVDDAPETPAAASADGTPRVRGTESVLLVEDEPAVRSLAAEILAQLGYTVRSAADAADAIAMLDAGPVQLLLTDVVLPRTSGPELARRVRERVPDVAVLFMSGYAGDALRRHGIDEIGAGFLQKPFTPDTMARAVRAVLERA